MEEGAGQELAAAASRVRRAVESFDHEREDRVEDLFDTIAVEPRRHVRLLRRMPEGVDRLVEGWEELRHNLTRADGPTWDESHQALATSMLGYRPGQAAAGELEQLSKAARGEGSLAAIGWTGVDDEAGRAWARELLLELIHTQISKLNDHRETLDLEVIEQDRIEAPGRVLFDFSKGGIRAMRYQSEARRMFFKALKDFRIAEAEFEAATPRDIPQPEPAPAPAPRPAPEPAARLASFREKSTMAARQPELAPSDLIFPPLARTDGQVRGLDGRVVAVGRAVVVPG